MTRRAIIHDRRFFWRYPDGRIEPVRLTARILAGLQQTKATEARNAANDDPPPPRHNGIGQGPRTPRRLPPHNLKTDKTVKELALEYGWDGADQFRMALRKNRPHIHQMALANGRARKAANMPRAMRRMQQKRNKEIANV